MQRSMRAYAGCNDLLEHFVSSAEQRGLRSAIIFVHGLCYLLPNVGIRLLRFEQAFKFKQVCLEDLRCSKSVARFRRWIIHDPYQMPKSFCSLLGKLIR